MPRVSRVLCGLFLILGSAAADIVSDPQPAPAAPEPSGLSAEVLILISLVGAIGVAALAIVRRARSTAAAEAE